MSRYIVLLLLACFGVPVIAAAQQPSTAAQGPAAPAAKVVSGNDPPPEDASKGWCEDSGTWCATNRIAKGYLAGVRFIAEPKLGYVFARTKELNRIESGDFANFTLIGAETNLWRAIVSLQGVLITPGKAKFDNLSPIVVDKRLNDPNNEISITSGFAGGLSFFDGVIATGWGRLNLDKRQIQNAVDAEVHSTFFYFNIQAVSAVRAALKRVK
jgi:hypothetical protein